MQDKIVVDFDALNRIAGRLQTVSRELDEAAGMLNGLPLTKDAGAEQRLGGGSRSLSTTGTSVTVDVVSSAVANYRGALGQVGGFTERLGNAVKNAASLFEQTESSLSGKELETGTDPFSGGGGSSGGTLTGGSGGGGAGGSGSGGGGGGAAGAEQRKTKEIPHLQGEGAVFSGDASGKSNNWLNAEGKVSGDAFGGSYDVSPTSVSGEVHLAQGKAEGSLFGGILGGSAVVAVGKVAAEGKVSASIYEEGKLRPNIGAEAKAEASVLTGDAKARLGSENNNAHGAAEGKVLTAEAKAGVKAGVYKTKLESGEEITVAGLKAEAGAEAYIASGKVSGGVRILGIDIDASIKGHIGTGATVGGEVSTSHAGIDLGAALGAGAGVSIDVDWSNFKLGW